MTDIKDYETRTDTTYKLDISGFIDELIRERLDEAFQKDTIKTYDVDYDNIVMGIIYEYLSFRTINPKGSVQDFLKTRHMENCITLINNNIM